MSLRYSEKSKSAQLGYWWLDIFDCKRIAEQSSEIDWTRTTRYSAQTILECGSQTKTSCNEHQNIRSDSLNSLTDHVCVLQSLKILETRIKQCNLFAKRNGLLILMFEAYAAIKSTLRPMVQTDANETFSVARTMETQDINQSFSCCIEADNTMKRHTFSSHRWVRLEFAGFMSGSGVLQGEACLGEEFMHDSSQSIQKLTLTSSHSGQVW